MKNTHKSRILLVENIHPVAKEFLENDGFQVDLLSYAPSEDELIKLFNEYPDFKNAFEKLTPGRRRAYNLFFTGAKQSSTRLSRIEKCVDRIMDGKGIND